MGDLYRLVYASKNLLQGLEVEAAAAITQILESSQRNNAAVDVTGALMFNGGAFAQVLEGPRRGVEDTFERIQRDLRHGDVTVLQCGPVESRGFANWSMAFVGQSARGQAQFSKLAAESGFDLSRLDGDAVFSMLHSLVLDEEGVVTSSPSLPSDAVDAPRSSVAVDIDQVRAELEELRPNRALLEKLPAIAIRKDIPLVASKSVATGVRGTKRAPRGSSEVALAVLKAALASERQCTTELRNEIDELRVALAASHDCLDGIREERGLWVKRARLLAAALCQEAEQVVVATCNTDQAPPTAADNARSAA
ncbi:BLUF domain-containing protein [Methylobacterium durans]|uniref:Blue light sensor protein n=1 Tax=Methylobacterium durans TaxID=2202825 RepID=A0A2U8W305_9HYPH|nr:BLUF domain-containing protein [Methylobacterium durans]AWN40447.1 blue light sensor protein [Methylobacterium durans]